MNEHHFDVIASILKKASDRSHSMEVKYLEKEVVALSFHKDITLKLCDYFSTVSERFDREKFLKASGYYF